MDDLQRINQDLRLWDFFPDAGKQLPYWQPRGAFIRSTIEDFWKTEHIKQGYDIVYTPHIGSTKMWTKSGHLERFSDKMFPPITVQQGDEEYFLRPMNCPFHILLFNSQPRSYRELPIRYAELGTVYRKIPSGSFTEMFEVRGFTQDDAHIFSVGEPAKAKEELSNLLQFTIYFLRDAFKIDDYRIIRRLKPKGSIGPDASWKAAQSLLQDVLEEKNLKYKDSPGEGIFYGPKIDFEIADAHYKKEWICSTIQLDLVLAKKFDIKYTTSGNRREPPLIIHRTILGSLERFIAILVSRSQGHLPLWLSPCQMMIVPIDGSEYQINLTYANNMKTILEDKLGDLKPRIRVASGGKSVADAKKDAIKEKIPFIVMLGRRERMNKVLSITSWTADGYSDPRSMTIDQLSEEFRNNIREKL